MGYLILPALVLVITARASFLELARARLQATHATPSNALVRQLTTVCFAGCSLNLIGSTSLQLPYVARGVSSSLISLRCTRRACEWSGLHDHVRCCLCVQWQHTEIEFD